MCDVFHEDGPSSGALHYEGYLKIEMWPKRISNRSARPIDPDVTPMRVVAIGIPWSSLSSTCKYRTAASVVTVTTVSHSLSHRRGRPSVAEL